MFSFGALHRKKLPTRWDAFAGWHEIGATFRTDVRYLQVTTFIYFTSWACVQSWINPTPRCGYTSFFIWEWKSLEFGFRVLYIYTPFGILTSFPFRDGERGATKTEIRLMSGSCLMKLHSKHLMFHFRPTAKPPLLILGSVASLLCFGVAAYNEFGWRFISVHFGNKWASLVMHFDAKKCNGIHRLKAIAML